MRVNKLLKFVVVLVVLAGFGLFVSQIVREYYWLQSLGGIDAIFDYGDE